MRRLATAVLLLHAGCGRIGYRRNDAALEGRDASIDTAIDAFRFDTNTPDVHVSLDAPLPDANLVSDAPTDAVMSDAFAPDAPCIAVPEACNGVDDDCDGRIDNGFNVVASWDACSTAPRVASVVVSTIAWDMADAVQAASLVEGGLESAGSLTTPGALLFDASRTLGNLLVPPASMSPQYFSMPFVGGNAAVEPNVNRVVIEIAWAAGWAAHDGPGADFVVYEHGDPVTEPEAFAVAVHDARTGTWSRARWQFYNVFNGTDRLFATLYDLADFNLVGGVIDRIRIESIFGMDAAQPDRVTNARGDGFVVRGTDADWAGAHTLALSAGLPGVPVGLLDADVIWVAALHPLVEPRCCVP